jgi:uncharacterized protein YndB with AHSA1/START domain
MLKWLFGILFVLIALLLGLLAAGAMLPVQHHVTVERTFHQTPEAVWQAITDHPNEPKWRADLESIRQLPDRDGHEVWEETHKDGQEIAIETIESQPPAPGSGAGAAATGGSPTSSSAKLVRKIVDQTAFGGTWTYQLTPSANGASATLSITEDGEVYNPAFRFISRFIMGQDTTIKKYLGALGKKFEE